MRCWLFPGQGSQYVGMLRDLVDAFPQARQRLHQAEHLLSVDIGRICFEGPAELLQQTQYTQPALFLHGAILVDLIRDFLPATAVAGHSLGEYTAFYAAGVLEFEDALRLVQLRGHLMAETAAQQPGTMAAVLGLEDAHVEAVCTELSRDGGVVPANYNAPGQLVISGSVELVQEAIERLRVAGALKVVQLPVSGAFHSPLMEPARARLARAIAEIPFHPPRVPIYCNVSAEPVYDVTRLREALVAQLTSPVRWKQTLQRLYADGIREFVELGPGRVLQGLVRRTLQGVTVLGLDTAEDVRRVQEQVYGNP